MLFDFASSNHWDDKAEDGMAYIKVKKEEGRKAKRMDRWWYDDGWWCMKMDGGYGLNKMCGDRGRRCWKREVVEYIADGGAQS